MTTNDSVTIYHYDEEAESWSVIYTGAAHTYLTCGGKPDKGMREDSEGVIRIPTEEDIPVQLGDKVVFGECTEPSPPKGQSYTVLQNADRRRGLNPHWRIEVK